MPYGHLDLGHERPKCLLTKAPDDPPQRPVAGRDAVREKRSGRGRTGARSAPLNDGGPRKARAAGLHFRLRLEAAACFDGQGAAGPGSNYKVSRVAVRRSSREGSSPKAKTPFPQLTEGRLREAANHLVRPNRARPAQPDAPSSRPCWQDAMLWPFRPDR